MDETLRRIERIEDRIFIRMVPYTVLIAGMLLHSSNFIEFNQKTRNKLVARPLRPLNLLHGGFTFSFHLL